MSNKLRFNISDPEDDFELFHLIWQLHIHSIIWTQNYISQKSEWIIMQ
jgi:hypothetical protein